MTIDFLGVVSRSLIFLFLLKRLLVGGAGDKRHLLRSLCSSFSIVYACLYGWV